MGTLNRNLLLWDLFKRIIHFQTNPSDTHQETNLKPTIINLYTLGHILAYRFGETIGDGLGYKPMLWCLQIWAFTVCDSCEKACPRLKLETQIQYEAQLSSALLCRTLGIHPKITKVESEQLQGKILFFPQKFGSSFLVWSRDGRCLDFGERERERQFLDGDRKQVWGLRMEIVIWTSDSLHCHPQKVAWIHRVLFDKTRNWS